MNQEMVVEQFYNQHLKDEISSRLTEKESNLALKLVKAISYTMWNNKNMSKEVLEEFLYGYNKDNLINMIKNAIKIVKEYDIFDKPIFTRDFTDVPKHFIFYNQEIEHYDNGDKLKTIFKNEKVFSTKDVKIGVQVGTVNKDGAVDLWHYEESTFDEKGCYVMLSFKETVNLETNTKSENIFLDYYLGNIDFN